MTLLGRLPWQRRPVTEPPTVIRWDDMQGNVLRGYHFDHGRFTMVTVTDPGAARRWLGHVAPTVTSGGAWKVRPDATLNLAFTHRGLAALGVDRSHLRTFPPDFRQGMEARAEDHLGDVGADHRSNWEHHGPHHPDVHMLVMVHGASAAACESRTDAALGGDPSAHGMAVVHTELLANLPAGPESGDPLRRIEHFGFADGISQPAVHGALQPSVVRGNGTPLPDGRWRAVEPGEFVLGHRDEEEAAPPLPSPRWLVVNGSYLVVRKLAQHVPAFREMVSDRAGRLGIEPALLAAKMMGRRHDGSPLLAPAEPPPDDLEERGVRPGEPRFPSDGDIPRYASQNDIRYGHDHEGWGCPLGSHVRRANPRDDFTSSPELVSRHRLLRRGMPYGPLLPEGADDDGVPRGLYFVAFCASIMRQFEFVQREWLNDGNMFGVGFVPDPIAGGGHGDRRFVLPGQSPAFLGDIPRLVTTRGGEYLFQPGLSALRRLAAGDR